MKTVKAVAVVMGVLFLLAIAMGLAVNHCMAAAEGSAELSFSCRLGIYSAHRFNRDGLLLAVLGLPVGALLGAIAPCGSTLAQERERLGAWLVLGGGLLCGEMAWLCAAAASGMGRQSQWLAWVPAFALRIVFGVTSAIASGVAAVRLQRRLEQRGSRLRAWHVGVGVPAVGPGDTRR